MAQMSATWRYGKNTTFISLSLKINHFTDNTVVTEEYLIVKYKEIQIEW